MSRRRERRRNKRDQFGIYEMPESELKKMKPGREFTLQDFLMMCAIIFVILVIVYSVTLGIKGSKRNKAYDLYQKEDYEGASKLYEEALKPRLPMLERFDNNVRYYLADCYVNMGKYGDACYEYNMIKLWSGKKKKEGLNYLQKVAYGLQLYDWKEYDAALPILLAAYEDGYKDLVLYVGSCYGQIGDLENMQAYYDIFLRDHEMNSFMYAQYAAIALDEGRLEDAGNYIETGKQLADQSNIKELLFDEIVYYEKWKDYNGAFEKAQAFIKAYPNDIDGKNEYDFLYTRQTLSK